MTHLNPYRLLRDLVVEVAGGVENERLFFRGDVEGLCVCIFGHAIHPDGFLRVLSDQPTYTLHSLR